MTHPIEQILSFPDADFVDKYLRAEMPAPYRYSVESSPNTRMERTTLFATFSAQGVLT